MAESNVPAGGEERILLRRIAITICVPCLEGQGEECHTPGCALWLHRVDLPINRGLYDVLDEYGINACTGELA